MTFVNSCRDSENGGCVIEANNRGFAAVAAAAAAACQYCCYITILQT